MAAHIESSLAYNESSCPSSDVTQMSISDSNTADVNQSPRKEVTFKTRRQWRAHLRDCAKCAAMAKGKDESKVKRVCLRGGIADPLTQEPAGDMHSVDLDRPESYDEVPRQFRRFTRLKAGVSMGDRYTIVQKLGSGSYGVVYEVEDRARSKNVALKIMYSASSRDDDVTRGCVLPQTMTELAILHQLRECETIVTLHDVTVHNPHSLVLASFELAECDLNTFVARGHRFRQGHTINFGLDLVNALEYAWERGIMHRDVKPANILVFARHDFSSVPSADCQYMVKLADWGLARPRYVVDAHKPISDAAFTLWYRPPEVILGDDAYARHNHNPTDVWGVGSVLAFLLLANHLVCGATPVAVFVELADLLGDLPPRCGLQQLPYWGSVKERLDEPRKEAASLESRIITAIKKNNAEEEMEVVLLGIIRLCMNWAPGTRPTFQLIRLRLCEARDSIYEDSILPSPIPSSYFPGDDLSKWGMDNADEHGAPEGGFQEDDIDRFVDRFLK